MRSGRESNLPLPPWPRPLPPGPAPNAGEHYDLDRHGGLKTAIEFLKD